MVKAKMPDACRTGGHELLTAMAADCASSVAAVARSSEGFERARGASPAKTARVMKPLIERPELRTRAANSSCIFAGGRYEIGGARLLRAMLCTVGGRHANLPRAFPARHDPRTYVPRKGRWVSKGRADISPLVVAGDETPVWVQGHEGS